jgi:Zn-dependent peptidase ImmA (M78 family)
MIKIISDEINDLLEFLNAEYPKDELFYLHICEGHDSIQDPYTEGLGFGMFNKETNHCYVAGDLEEEQVLKTIAHEYKHFLQKYDEVEFNEKEAEDFSDEIYKRFTCEIRQTVEDCIDCVFCDEKGESK